jgi:hypothetical protein
MVAEGESLPRSYLIKQCKEELNKLCHITRTPGVPVGAQLDFNTELQSEIKAQVILTPVYREKIRYLFSVLRC